jgi:hypothetical protein
LVAPIAGGGGEAGEAIDFGLEGGVVGGFEGLAEGLGLLSIGFVLGFEVVAEVFEGWVAAGEGAEVLLGALEGGGAV